MLSLCQYVESWEVGAGHPDPTVAVVVLGMAEALKVATEVPTWVLFSCQVFFGPAQEYGGSLVHQ